MDRYYTMLATLPHNFTGKCQRCQHVRRVSCYMTPQGRMHYCVPCAANERTIYQLFSRAFGGPRVSN